jgi:hypothetical protein
VAPREVAEKVVAMEGEGEASYESMLNSVIARAAANTGYPSPRRGMARMLEKK